MNDFLFFFGRVNRVRGRQPFWLPLITLCMGGGIPSCRMMMMMVMMQTGCIDYYKMAPRDSKDFPIQSNYCQLLLSMYRLSIWWQGRRRRLPRLNPSRSSRQLLPTDREAAVWTGWCFDTILDVIYNNKPQTWQQGLRHLVDPCKCKAVCDCHDQIIFEYHRLNGQKGSNECGSTCSTTCQDHSEVQAQTPLNTKRMSAAWRHYSTHSCANKIHLWWWNCIT